MRKTLYRILFFYTFISLFSCAEKEEIILNDSVVVESYLIPDQPVSVKITKEIPFISKENGDTVLNDLIVKIVYNGADYQLMYKGNHLYMSSPDLKVKTGGTYQLEFDYKGKRIIATTTIPDKTPNFKSSVKSIAVTAITSSGFGGGFPSFPDPVKLTWYNPSGDYHLVVIENTETSPKLINTTTSDDDDRPVFRSEPISNNTYEIQPMRFTYFGKHRLILFKINAEYAAVYKSAGSSSQNLNKPFTNITNGSGIFTGVSPSDTLALTVNRN